MNIKEKEIKKDYNEENEEILSIPPDCTNTENNEIKEKSICDFIIKEKLGEGTFGKVRLGINIQTEEKVAIKILDKKKIKKDKDKKRLEKEIKILESLRHPNIVHLYSDIQNNSYIYLIMEYIKGIELLKYISSNSKLTEEEACFYFRQIISSIEYLHKLKIAHRDIKPENMIIEDSTKTIKLIDFGLSSYYNTKSETLSSACGSPSYAPPEMLTGKKYNAIPIDIWSCGIVLYAMICGYLPFEDEDHDILFRTIKEGKFRIPQHVSESAQDLIKNILVVNPKKRYTIAQIKKHKWFNLCLNNENYRNKKSLYEGLLLNKYVIPIDEQIINTMNNEYKIEKEKIRECLLKNEHNDITTIYYLILLKNSKLEKDSIADLKGNLFKKYLENNKNLLSNYDNDINKVINERKIVNEDFINHNNIEEKEEKINDEYIISNNPEEKQDNNEKDKINTNNNLDKNITNNITNDNENINIDNTNIQNKKLTPISIQKEKNEKKNQNKINNKNKKFSPETIKETLKLMKINQLKKNAINSASKREIKKKINVIQINEIIQKNKVKSKGTIKTISGKDNKQILFKNPTYEKTKGIKKVKENKNTPNKHNNLNKDSENKDNTINTIKINQKDNQNINKKKSKTYRPNTVLNEKTKKKPIYNNKEDKVSKTITITNPNSNNKRVCISAGKRKIDKYNKTSLKMKPIPPMIKTHKNNLSLRQIKIVKK